MLKKMCMLLLTAGLMLNTTALVEANTEQSAEILLRIDEVNKDLDSVLEETNSIILRHYEQQTDVEHVVYRSKDGVYIQTSSLGEALVDRGEGVYGRDSEDEADYYRVICATDSDYEAYKEGYEFVVWYISELLESPAVVTEEGDQIIVYISDELTDEDKAELAEECGVEADDVQEHVHRLEVSADTLLINRIVTTLICGTGDILMTDIEAQYGVEDPGNPEGMDEFINAADVRTLTLTKEPGTGEEETTSYTIRKGCRFTIVKNEYELYSDEACTMLYDNSSDRTTDSVLYLKKK